LSRMTECGVSVYLFWIQCSECVGVWWLDIMSNVNSGPKTHHSPQAWSSQNRALCERWAL